MAKTLERINQSVWELREQEEVMKQKIEEFHEKFSTSYYAASRQMVDAVIRPQETRPQLIKALKALQHKSEERPAKKHGNIPL